MLLAGVLLGPKRAGKVKEMPYESGMDPIHDTRRRFDVRFPLVAIAFLIFDVELLFIYPWAVASRTEGIFEGQREMVFIGFLVFFVLLLVGYLYDWRKGVFRWR